MKRNVGFIGKNVGFIGNVIGYAGVGTIALQKPKEMLNAKDNVTDILQGIHSVDNRVLFLLQECASMLDNMDSNELEQLFQTSTYNK